MQTIFITSFNPFISRNMLASGVLSNLSAKDGLRIVIFAPDYKEGYFQNNFSGKNIMVIGVPKKIITKRDVIFRYLGNSLINTNTLKIHKKEKLLKDRKIHLYLASRLLMALGILNIIKRLVRFFDLLTIKKRHFQKYFEIYQPALVFATDVFHDDDAQMMAEAKHRGIFTIGMIRSWDNITNKGLFRIKPDKLIVHNEIIKDEAIRYADMPPKNIFVSGLPHFDYYLTSKRTPREQFFRELALDLNQRSILFSPHGNRFHDTDWQIMQILKDAINNNLIPPVQVLVRFPPNDDVSLGNFVPDKNFAIARPGLEFQKGVFYDREVTQKDLESLADSLYHCDLVITYNSTIIVDAAVFDKPAIGVAFDGWEKKSYLKSIAKFMDYDHTQKLLKTGGLKVVRSKEELLEAVNLYLRNPKLGAENRKKIVETQCWKLDGQSGKRIAEFIYGQL